MEQVYQDRLRMALDNMPYYEQAHGVLERVDENGNKTNCCLGVLCREAIKQGLKLKVSIDHGYVEFGERRETAGLPPEIQKFYGLNSNPVIADDGSVKKISAIEGNDVRNWSLGQIADAFRNTYLSEE